jgi:hypothetical protein
MRSIIFLLVISFHILFAQDVLTWTSANGHSFKGSFLRIDGQTIVLKGTDGKEVRVPINALDAPSVKNAEREHQKALKNRPLFTHENRNLRFSLSPKNQWLTLEFLEAGQVIDNKSYEIDFLLAEVPDRKWKNIKVKGLHGKIEKGRSDVRMELLMENGVIIEFTVDVNDKDELSYSYETVDVPSGLPRISLRTSLRFPKLLEYEMKTQSYIGILSKDGVLFKDLPEFFEGYELRVEKSDGKSQKILYHEKQDRGISASSFTILMPNKKSIEMDGPNNIEDGQLYIYFYSGKSPFEGFSMRTTSSTEKQNDSGPFTIRLK